MDSNDIQLISQLALPHFHNPEAVQAIIAQIARLESVEHRRLALHALIDQLIAVDELEAAVHAARLTPDLTTPPSVTDVDPFLKSALLLAIGDRMLAQQRLDHAVQVIDEAARCLDDLDYYNLFTMPTEEPWLQFTRRYLSAGLPERAGQVWERAIVWVRSLEQRAPGAKPHCFQPTDSSYFLARIAADMAWSGFHKRAGEIAAAVTDATYRAWALSQVNAPIARPLDDGGSFTRVVQTDLVVAGVALPYLVYTGPASPTDPAAKRALTRAYRSEVLLRYTAWAARHLPPDCVPVPLRYRELRLWLPSFIYDDEEGLTSAQPLFSDIRARLEQWHDLILLGPSGSGKTTTLWCLARDLAHDGLVGDEHARLPFMIELSTRQPGRDAHGLLRDALEGAVVPTLDGWQLPLAAHRLMAQWLPVLLAEERLVLLWDGVDEVPRSLAGDTSAVIEAQRSASVRRVQNIVTCRSGAYPLTSLYSKGLHVTIKQATIEPLDEPSIHRMISDRLGDAQGQALLALLALPTYTVLTHLRNNPLLLAMLCEVYGAYGELPASRGHLLKAFVAARLDAHGAEEQTLAEQLELALARLAYTLTITRGRGSATPLDETQQHGRNDKQAPATAPQPLPGLQIPTVDEQTRLLRLAVTTGLLTLTGDGINVRFNHASVQDYFAAVALRARLGGAKEAPAVSPGSGHLGHSSAQGWQHGWEETLLLLASIHGAGDPLRQQLVNALAPIPLLAARAIHADPAMGEPDVLWLVRDSACAQIGDVGCSLRQRLDAGVALGLVADPRTPLSPQAWGEMTTRRNRSFGQPNGYWCYVGAGRYRIGGWVDGQEAAHVALGGFWIGRLPITVAQFSRFAPEGYSAVAKRWWSSEGWAWRVASRCTEPQHWEEPQYTGLSQPVVGVSWYEAAAYCSWLTECLRDVLPLGLVIRLPTEAEWEVASSVDTAGLRRRYPWGDTVPTVDHAICNETRQAAPAPVGCCPAGAAACGALDFLGNIEEWCASWYSAYPEGSGRAVHDPKPGNGVVLGPLGPQQLPVRGGWWAKHATELGCDRRFWHEASAASYTTGFRVVLASPDGVGGPLG